MEITPSFLRETFIKPNWIKFNFDTISKPDSYAIVISAVRFDGQEITRAIWGANPKSDKDEREKEDCVQEMYREFLRDGLILPPKGLIEKLCKC